MGRRWLSFIAAGVVAVTGCESELGSQLAESPSPTPVPTATPSPGPETAPLLLTRGSEIAAYRDGRLERIGSVDGDAKIAVDAGEHGVGVEEVFGSDPERSRLVLVDAAGGSQVIDAPDAEQRNLFDSADIDGAPHLIYRTYSRTGTEFPVGSFFLQAVGTSEWTKVSGAAGGLSGMTRASYGDGVIVAHWVHDLADSFTFLRPDGTEVEGLPDPTEDLPYGGPPLMVHPVLAPDGATLAYLEGPTYAVGSDEEAELVGDWELVVIDMKDGEEWLRVQAAPQRDRVTWLDFDGRWAVVSRTERAYGAEYPGEPLPTLAINTDAEDPAPIELPMVVGRTTILDLPR